MSRKRPLRSAKSSNWTLSSRTEFYDYYAEKSNSEITLRRLNSLKDRILKVYKENTKKQVLDVGDIGGGAGSLSLIWAEEGHRVRSVDVNAQLITLAQERAADQNLNINFSVASATDLPWADQSLDICCIPELLEHVADWQRCLDELSRVLRPGGVLYLSTSNKLCPKQFEFTLPFYSWFPGFLKDYVLKLATTSRPELANYATFPAVNWFTPFGITSALRQRGFDRVFDNFDLAALGDQGMVKASILTVIRSHPLFRFFGYVAYPATVIIALKSDKLN